MNPAEKNNEAFFPKFVAPDVSPPGRFCNVLLLSPIFEQISARHCPRGGGQVIFIGAFVTL